MVVIPAGFVSDHMEVRHDLDVEAAETAETLGLAFARAATPGTSPRFASMITELVTERMALPDHPMPDHPMPDHPSSEIPERDTTVSDNPKPGGTAARAVAALGCMGMPSQTCPADCCGGTR